MEGTNPPDLDLNGKMGEAPIFVRDDLFEARPKPGAGIATFATAPIASGTRLFCEEALIVMPDEARQLEVFRAVSALSEKKQTAYWELAADSKPSKIVDWINDLRQSCDGADESFNVLVEAHEQAWSIYETNRFSMRFPGTQCKFGIFHKAARLNHSCSPNVFHRYNPHINRLTINALRDIEPGEELNTSYIDICHPTVVRRRMLKDWGFCCQCVACNSTIAKQDHERKKIEDVMTKVKKREKQRGSNGNQWGESEYQKSMKLIEQGVRLMKEQAMEETDTLGYLLTLAAKYGSKSGCVDEAVGWAKKALEIEEKCLGEDSNEYQAARELYRTLSQGP